MTVTYNGTTYFYATNLQGDIVAILDSTGAAVVKYTYNAWGNLLTTTGSMASTLGIHNPLRYRGYVYDTETGLYYLQSRYYNPEMGRFINADTYITTGQGLLSNNTFAYCLNNPVNRTDTSGTASLWYYLIVDSDMGFIHRCVQLHILANNTTTLRKELVLGGHGRADIVDVRLGTVWEVKHASVIPIERAAIATAQARGYIGGTQGNTTITDLGAANAFSGSFIIQCDKYYYDVTYHTPQKGAILYSVKEVTNYEGSVYAVYVPKVNQKEDTSLASPAIALIGLAVCGGGGSGRISSVHSIAIDAAYLY